VRIPGATSTKANIHQARQLRAEGLERRGIADIQSGASSLEEDIHYAEEVHGKLVKERKGRERYGVHIRESVWIVGSKGDD